MARDFILNQPWDDAQIDWTDSTRRRISDVVFKAEKDGTNWIIERLPPHAFSVEADGDALPYRAFSPVRRCTADHEMMANIIRKNCYLFEARCPNVKSLRVVVVVLKSLVSSQGGTSTALQVHRDGAHQICVTMLKRENIIGGTMHIYDHDTPQGGRPNAHANPIVSHTLRNTYESVVFDDRQFMHSVALVHRQNDLKYSSFRSVMLTGVMFPEEFDKNFFPLQSLDPNLVTHTWYPNFMADIEMASKSEKEDKIGIFSMY